MPAAASHQCQTSENSPQPQDAHAALRPEWRCFAEQIRDRVLRPVGNLSPKDVQDLADYLATSPDDLHVLDLNWKPIEDAGAAMLAKALMVNTRLKALDLTSCGIGIDGAASLAKALMVNASLNSFTLFGSEIGPAGAESVADMLKVNTSLTSLNLGLCFIAVDGAESLSRALKVNTSLRSLVLSNNGIGAEGAAFLSQALEVNIGLKSLTLLGNGIDDDGVAHLAKALKVNVHLDRLELGFNSIQQTGRKALLAALACNKTLHCLSFFNDLPFDPADSYQEAKDQALRDNWTLWNSLPAASAGLELASGQAYPPELMPLILKQMIFSPNVPKQAVLATIGGLRDSLEPPVKQPGS